ncbi:MAG TPA: hypothetical protein VMK12_17550, partial [Anaeromyxobacteraceae bacterium]|nr:hypothetical protein [Anaeromyxobacteraceae bacterium]
LRSTAELRGGTWASGRSPLWASLVVKVQLKVPRRKHYGQLRDDIESRKVAPPRKMEGLLARGYPGEGPPRTPLL